MKMHYWMIVTAFLMASAVAAQSPEKEVEAVIRKLFTGMEKSDTATVRSVFAQQVTMATVMRDKTDNPVLHRESSIDGWLKAIAAPRKETLYEEIWNVKVQRDGDFAQAWCDYAFYIDNTFSHCGVDAFHLHKGKEGWKIFHVADTRRKQGCQIPKEIQDKHK
jgi:hypothetical protein